MTMQALTLKEFQKLASLNRRVTVFTEITAGDLTPVKIYKSLDKLYKNTGILLEDLRSDIKGRKSYLCFEPLESLRIHRHDALDPLMAIRALKNKYAFATRPDIQDKITSAAGFITYDAARYFEDLPDRHLSSDTMPEFLFHFYALSLTFDYDKQSLLISTLVAVSDNHEHDYQAAQKKLDSIIQLLSQTITDHHPSHKTIPKSVDVDTSDSDFINMVQKAQTYIKQGDAFQIVLSRCFKREYSVTPLKIYETLCKVSPSPFMFYFPTDSQVIVGASPEIMVRVRDNQVTVNPIAGTRQFANNANANAADLLSDKKELAEHMMLVDLARNDVGVVSEPGTVEVSELLQVKHYSHVSHITSTVTGKLSIQYDALDAFAATFPAGTLSGAPKIRAMQIIDELETSRRGIYGGAICRLDPLGNFDSCIAIRMAVLEDGIATVRTGAGVVYDSNPIHEARETRQKAQAMLNTIAQAHGE